MLENILFYGLAALIVVPAVCVVAVRNVFHAALWLVASLAGVAGMYAFLAADFLFAVQLLVYAGGITVILLFIVLLSGKPADWAGAQINEKAWPAFLFCGLFVALIISTIAQWPLRTQLETPRTTVGQLGGLLLNEMVLPFEAISLVLVAALVGAIYFSAKRAK